MFKHILIACAALCSLMLTDFVFEEVIPLKTHAQQQLEETQEINAANATTIRRRKDRRARRILSASQPEISNYAACRKRYSEHRCSKGMRYLARASLKEVRIPANGASACFARFGDHCQQPLEDAKGRHARQLIGNEVAPYPSCSAYYTEAFCAQQAQTKATRKTMLIFALVAGFFAVGAWVLLRR